MTIPVIRLAVGVSALTMTAALHAATPMSLPLGDLGLPATGGSSLTLPVPPPPPRQISKPEILPARIVIKGDTSACGAVNTTRMVREKRQVAVEPDPWVTTPVWFRLG